MNGYCLNRLLVVGLAKDLKAFYRDESWMKAGNVRHIELMEHSPNRHAWQFDTNLPPLPFLRTISRQWKALTFLIGYDREDISLKGLVKARNGRVRHFRVSY